MRIVLALFTLLLCLPSVSRAAYLFLRPNQMVYNVNESMQIDAVLEPQGTAGPGEIEFTIVWGQSPGLAVGAARLEQAVAFAPGFGLAPGSSDCSELVGQISGSCSVRAIASAAVSGLSVPVLQLRMTNLWIAPPGYEFCVFHNDPGCVSAIPWSDVAALDQSLFGVQIPGASMISVGAIGGDPRIRPVPEPASAALVALGLAAFAWRTRRVPSPRPI